MSCSWWPVSKYLGCGSEETGEKSLSCMRSKKHTEILDAMKKTGTSGLMTSFGATADGKVVFNDYATRLADGNFIKAPLLIGNNDDEGGLTAALDKLRKPASASRKERRQSGVEGLNLGCAAVAAAAGRRKNGVPAWRYLYKGVYPNTDIGSTGAYHTAEISMVFGTTASFSHKVSQPFLEEML